MSDKKKPAEKRGYRIDNGKALSYDLRVRIPESLRKSLAEYAKRNQTTSAAAARSILQEFLTAEK